MKRKRGKIIFVFHPPSRLVLKCLRSALGQQRDHTFISLIMLSENTGTHFETLQSGYGVCLREHEYGSNMWMDVRMIDGLMTVVINLISVQQRLVVVHRKMFDFRNFDGHSLVKASLEDKCPPLRPLGLKNRQNSPEGVHMPVCLCVAVRVCCPCVLVPEHAVNHIICLLRCIVCRTFLTANRPKKLLHQDSLWQTQREAKESWANKWREKIEERKAKDQQKRMVTAYGLDYSRISL